MTDIVDRLREQAGWLRSCGYNVSALNMDCAADEIDRLRAEVELARKNKDEAWACYELCKAEAERLKADAARWRWWRQRWTALCGFSCASLAGLDLRNVYVNNAEKMDAVTDDAMAQEPRG